MRIHLIKKANVNSKPVAYCEMYVDDPPPMAKKS